MMYFVIKIYHQKFCHLKTMTYVCDIKHKHNEKTGSI